MLCAAPDRAISQEFDTDAECQHFLHVSRADVHWHPLANLAVLREAHVCCGSMTSCGLDVFSHYLHVTNPCCAGIYPPILAIIMLQLRFGLK